MITKRVNRYYCEHCGKGGCSAGHMRRHEERCTLNPQRVCGMCRFDEEAFSPEPLADLVSRLPDPDLYKKHDDKYGFVYYDGGLGDAVKAIWADFEKAADGCPACMLAAIRQAGLGNGLLNGDLFDYKKAVASIFATHREAEKAQW